MLHNNISVTRGSYDFAQVDVDIDHLATLKSQQPGVVVDDDPDTPEQRNTRLAKNIALHRDALKIMLSEVPLSAAWLLYKYGQYRYNYGDFSAEAEDGQSVEQLDSLAVYYQNAELNAAEYGLQSTQFIASRRLLSEALRNFVLTAEQLKNLVEVVTYAYAQQAIRNLKCSSLKVNLRQSFIQKIEQLSVLNGNKLAKELCDLGLDTNNAVLTAFLVPPDNQLHTSLRHLLRTQALWVSARQKLAEANARLVLFMANQYKGGFLEFNDLVQEGQIGLLKAVDRFDHLRGFQFSTYAVYWIRQGISRGLARSERVVRLPFGQIANISKVYRAKEVFFTQTGQEMPISDLAIATQLSEAEVVNILLIGQPATSLDAAVGDEENASSLVDFMEQQVFDAPLNKIADQELIEVINTALNGLSEKEAQVIRSRFGIHRNAEMTLEEIGQTLNLTRERVRQIQTIALKKLNLKFGSELVHFL